VDYGTIYGALEFLAHRWTMEILESLADKPKGFNDLQRSVNVAHPTSFNIALQRLVEHGLVRRPSRRGQTYALTPAGERALPLVIRFVEELDLWAEDEVGQAQGSS
jgi:DNA-binding HxlR family transcriptional regulator